MPEKKRTLEDHLIEKIKESGYPLEIEISALLDKKYIVFNTQYYFDEEIEQGRDIDIYAIPFFNLERFSNEELAEKFGPFELRTEIAVECKKSDTHAWVFYTRPLIRPVSVIYTDGQYSDDFSSIGIVSPVRSHLFLERALHYGNFKEAAIAYDEIKKKGNAKSRREIFEAVNQLVKFVSYEMRPPKETSAPTKHFSIFMMFPIIVFDGDMFEVTLESGEPKIERRKQLLLNTHYRSTHTQKVESFLIDVVQRSYFPRFIETLNQDFARIQNVILQDRDNLAKEVMETRQKMKTKRSNHSK